MKLRPQNWHAEAHHPEGERRWVTRFAWLPILTTDGVYVWLERYTRKERYTYKSVYPFFGKPQVGWSWKFEEAYKR